MASGPDERYWRGITVGSLEPALRKEVMDVASELGREGAVTEKTSLHFLLRLYQAEKAKEKGREEALRKAECLIPRISALIHEAHAKEMERKRAEGGKKPFHWGEPAEMPLSSRAISLLESVGITDRRTMAHIVDLLGEGILEERVELIHSSHLGQTASKALFGHKPDLLVEGDEGGFARSLEDMEAKKQMVDNRYSELGMDGPVYINYPEILVDSFHEVARIMEIRPSQGEPAPAEDGKRRKLRVSPIGPDEFIKVLRAMGFEIKSNGPHRVLSHEDGRVSVVQSAHGPNKEFGAGLIRMKLRESGITVEDFQKKRTELGV
jgi:predicted RNA binding protein YcfA (HicA-like mRNA interferase family)